MSYQVGQVSYSLFPAIASIGQLGDNRVNRIFSKMAAETINPGRGVELTSNGNIQQVQQTSSTLNLIGFSVLRTSREGVGNNNDTTNSTGAAYLAGEMVPVLYQGTMYAEWKGTTQTENAVPNMYHSSTTATDRGKVTDANTATTTGAEITACPSWVKLSAKLPGSGSLALISVNAPGAV